MKLPLRQTDNSPPYHGVQHNSVPRITLRQPRTRLRTAWISFQYHISSKKFLKISPPSACLKTKMPTGLPAAN